MVNRSKKALRKSSNATHRSTLSLQKTEVLVNVYDLLPPGRLASTLWTIGSSLLHTGVVINNREYAYGGHDEAGMSGVYWTRPKLSPPGSTFKCEVLHGFTIYPEQELNQIIRDLSSEYLGPSYNLLKKNCNHFTNELCLRLTSRSAPRWLNRAAHIGVALPCIVPPEFLEPPDYQTAAGELVERAPSEHEDDEYTGMLDGSEEDGARSSHEASERESVYHIHPLDDLEGFGGRSNKTRRKSHDSGGRSIPLSDRPLRH